MAAERAKEVCGTDHNDIQASERKCLFFLKSGHDNGMHQVVACLVVVVVAVVVLSEN